MPRKSEVPFGAQFSPNQVDLPTLLKMIEEKAGDRRRITQAIQDKFFADHAAGQRWKLADNTVLSLRAYGLLDEEAARPTPVASDLLEIASNPEQLYERFAHHILTGLRGHDFVETVIAMQTSGESVTLVSLRERLKQRGLYVPRGAVHLSSMRLWLAKAGVFGSEARAGSRVYEVDRDRLRQITGADLDEIDRLGHLSFEQRSYLRALVRLSEDDPLRANDVADLAAGLYSACYNYKSLPTTILFPLRDLGYVQVEKSTTGRGGKPYMVYRTDKFRTQIAEPILDLAAARARLVPRQLFDRPLDAILADLDQTDSFIKGQALELLAIYFTRLLDLDFRGWRLRSVDTGGAEVDVIVEGARLIFSRWQIQAKNTKTVRLDDIAREVGLSLTFVYSNVVVAMTTGDFTSDAYDYADHVMKNCNLNLILLNGADLHQIADDPTRVVGLLNAKAERAMEIKARTDYLRP